MDHHHRSSPWPNPAARDKTSEYVVAPEGTGGMKIFSWFLLLVQIGLRRPQSNLGPSSSFVSLVDFPFQSKSSKGFPWKSAMIILLNIHHFMRHQSITTTNWHPFRDFLSEVYNLKSGQMAIYDDKLGEKKAFEGKAPALAHPWAMVLTCIFFSILSAFTLAFYL